MNTNTKLAGLAVLVAMAASIAPANAHHAFSAEFDAAQPVEVKGVVSKFEVVNPHSWLYVDVKGADGKVTNWGFEFGAPYSLKEKGITKSSLVVGSEVTIAGFRAKSGKEFGYSVAITLPDGHKIGGLGGAPDAPKASEPSKS
jgi:hypothetical protein